MHTDQILSTHNNLEISTLRRNFSQKGEAKNAW